MTYSHVSKIERGVLRMPTEDVRQRIHNALGTTEQDLVDAGVLQRIYAGGMSVLIPANEVDATEVTSYDPTSPSYAGSLRLDDVVDAIAGAAANVAWTQSMLDTIIKQIESFQHLQKSNRGVESL